MYFIILKMKTNFILRHGFIDLVHVFDESRLKIHSHMTLRPSTASVRQRGNHQLIRYTRCRSAPEREMTSKNYAHNFIQEHINTEPEECARRGYTVGIKKSFDLRIP